MLNPIPITHSQEPTYIIEDIQCSVKLIKGQKYVQGPFQANKTHTLNLHFRGLILSCGATLYPTPCVCVCVVCPSVPLLRLG
jgi:hypothetical protein